MIVLIFEWLSTILFIIATRKMSGEEASSAKVRLKALWMYLIGSCCLIIFALFLGAWKFLLYFSLESLTGLGLITAQVVIAIYDIRGIRNCRREMNEITDKNK